MQQQIIKLQENQDIVIDKDTESFGLFIGTKNASAISQLNIIHNKPHFKSLTLIKAILFDASKFNCEAKIVINKGAVDTDAYLKIDVLVVGEDARARAIPSLEITEDSVKAGHGATIGKMDDEQIFYLESRGLSRDTAESIIISGFLDEFFARINNKATKLELYKSNRLNEQKRFSDLRKKF